MEVESYQKLWEVLKLAMVLSHGQSEIERGFSANKDILSSNMQADTLTEYRLVYDAVRKMPEAVEDMTISKSMLESCRMARSRYALHIEETKKSAKPAESDSLETQLNSQLKGLVKTKQLLQAEYQGILDKADTFSNQAEKLHKWNKLVEANALRDRGKLKRKDLDDTEESISNIQNRIKVECQWLPVD